jgi:hypothetical protein
MEALIVLVVIIFAVLCVLAFKILASDTRVDSVANGTNWLDHFTTDKHRQQYSLSQVLDGRPTASRVLPIVFTERLRPEPPRRRQ